MNKTVKGFKFVTRSMGSMEGKEAPWVIGKWKKLDGPENSFGLCTRGYHASETPLEAFSHAYGGGYRLFKIEARGHIIGNSKVGTFVQAHKFCASEMRLVKEIPEARQIAVKFALYCAKQAMPIYEKDKHSEIVLRLALRAIKKWLDAKTPAEKEAAEEVLQTNIKNAEAAYNYIKCNSARYAINAIRTAAEVPFRAALTFTSEVSRMAALAKVESMNEARKRGRPYLYLAIRDRQNKKLEQIIKEDQKGNKRKHQRER